MMMWNDNDYNIYNIYVCVMMIISVMHDNEMYDDEYDLLLSAVRVLSLVEVTSKRLHQTIEVTKYAISYGITTVRTDTDQMWIWE